MKPTVVTCDPVRISLYQDGEMTPEEQNRFEKHLAVCPDCMRILDGERAVSQMLAEHYAENAPRLDAGFARDVREALRNRQTPLHERLREGFCFKRALYPLTAFALLAMISLSVIRYHDAASPEPGPSAIVDSFSGNVASVMILEVPESRQTIIWYTESEPDDDGIETMEI